MRRRLPITTDTAEVIRPGSSDEAELSSPASPGPLAVPQPAAARPAVPRAPDLALRGPGVQGLGRPDRHHRLRAARPRRHPGPVRPVPDHPVRPAPQLRPAPRRCRGPGRRAQRAHGSRRGRHHDGLLPVGLKRKQQAIRSVGSLAVDAAGNPAPFTSPTAYQRASVSVPFGNCTEPSNVKAGGERLPDPLPVRRLRLLPTRPVLPARPRTAHRRPARRPGDRPGDRRRRLRHRQPHRGDPRLHRRRRADAPPAGRTRPPTSATRSSRPASSCAGPAPPGSYP